MNRLLTFLRFRRILIGGILTLVVIYFAGPTLLSTMGAWLNIGGPLATPVHFGYVLGGGADVRPVTAAALYRAGLVQKILIPNPSSDSGSRCKPLSESEIVRSVLMQEGIPENDVIVLGGQPRSTEEEMGVLAQFLRDQAECDVALVTHDYHSRRVSWEFQRQKKMGRLRKPCRMCVVSVPTDGYSAKNWWCTEDGLLNYGLEFAKTLRDFWRVP